MKEIIGKKIEVSIIKRMECPSLSCGTVFKFSGDEVVGLSGRRGKFVTCPKCQEHLAVNSATAKIWEVLDDDGVITWSAPSNHDGRATMRFNQITKGTYQGKRNRPAQDIGTINGSEEE